VSGSVSPAIAPPVLAVTSVNSNEPLEDAYNVAGITLLPLAVQVAP
jgi:hypothetical protein